MNYRKIRKLLVSPRQFFVDALNNKINPGAEVRVKAHQENSTVKSPKLKDSVKVKVKVEEVEKVDLSCGEYPDWYNSNCHLDLKREIKDSQQVYLFIPWIPEHSNALIGKLINCNGYTLLPINFVENISNNSVRNSVAKYARQYPHLYRRMLIKAMAPIRSQVTGVIFTFDWSPAMRIIANVCEELEIPRILIPHESIFMNRDKYYHDILGFSSLPVADVILGWGEVQRDIFVERGYPTERYHIVGAPKFDAYYNYKTYLTREQFYRLFGLNHSQKTILFAAQPLDSQVDTAQARISQCEAIADLLNYITVHNYQLIVRLPPSKDEVLSKELTELLSSSDNAAIDTPFCYLTTPEEALYHADVIASINSTMLLEGMLLHRGAVSIKYIEFEPLFAEVGIPVVESQSELYELLDVIMSGNFNYPLDAESKAAALFGCGFFDGKATERISAFLTEFPARCKRGEFTQHSVLYRFLHNETLDVVGIPSAKDVLEQGAQKYLKQLINAREVISTIQNNFTLNTLYSVEAFFQWGITESNSKRKQRRCAAALSRPVLIIEDGFIRSIDIGLSGTPGLSIMTDDITAYYDATKPSRLSLTMQSERVLISSQIERARLAMDKIVCNRVSKYNHAKCVPITIGTKGRKKVLLIDQRFGDQSVASGLADESTFENMLHDVIRNHPDCDILIKQHPDAIKGGKSSYYSDERLAFTKYVDNIFTINFDINPYALLDLVDEVYVVTSGMGFEALLAGKVVHCYGMPFYAGWGLTQDQITLPSRTKQRSLEEIFYFAYIEFSRYFNPEASRQVEVEDMVDYIVKNRGW